MSEDELNALREKFKERELAFPQRMAEFRRRLQV
jgi:hypothetical protein